MKICKCGCGNQIEIKPWHKRIGIPDYIKGHYWNGKKRPDTSELMKVIMKGKICYWKGKKRPEHGIKISGPNHPWWKGGIAAEPYCDIWLDKEYKECIKERDGYKCLNPECNKISDRLCLHHIDYNKKNCEPQNLVTICNSCNGKANIDRDWHESWYKAIIYNRYLKIFQNKQI